MKKFLVNILCVISVFGLYAQTNNDKAIVQITRDNSYLSADVRAATEEEARSEALSDLSAQVDNYLRTNNLGGSARSVESSFRTMTSQISSNRYRVLAYVKKSDLGGSADESGYDSYPVEESPYPEKMIEEKGGYGSGTVSSVNQDFPAAIRELSQIGRGDKVAPRLLELRNDGKIKSAAAFPVANFSDFYVILINPANEVETILHFDGSSWRDILNGNSPVNPGKYKNYTAFWFTI